MPAVKEAPVETYETVELNSVGTQNPGGETMSRPEVRLEYVETDESMARLSRIYCIFPFSFSNQRCFTNLATKPGDLNRMNILHVAGTKGKGTTCAFTQSILQQLQDTLGIPTRIGLYTSPHLVSVRERIRINSTAISENLFTRYFFEVWNALGLASLDSYWNDGQFETRKPTYFRFLTLMAFHVFMQENVDVAIVEVGVGGELDSTNIIEKPVAVAITTLGIDHVQTLGGTIEEIAWHKAGVMKNGCPSFTIEQVPEAMRVLEVRAQEKDARLIKVSSAMIPRHLKIRPDEEYQRSNASIAVALARAVIDKMGISITWCPTDLPTPVINGLESMVFRGRCETMTIEDINWHFDGAHTEQSLEVACRWFRSVSPMKSSLKILIFNQQSTRDTRSLLEVVYRTLCRDGRMKFQYVVFCTNVTFKDQSWEPELVNLNASLSDLQSLKAQRRMATTWRDLDPAASVVVLPTIQDAVEFVRDLNDGVTKIEVLATGSFYLVGGIVSLLGGEVI